MVERAAAMGLIIDGDAGETSHMSFDLRWHFDPATELFTVQCTRRPFMVNCATINERISELVDSCQGEIGVTGANVRGATSPT
jgi:hypothetical protein